MDGWHTLPWTRLQRQVLKRPKRRYRATRRHDVRTVRKRQRLLLHSWSVRLLAVRQVTQDNRGKRTAGVDGVKSLTPPQRLALAQSLTLEGTTAPVRRVWIPQPGSTEHRPLGIPICLAYCLSLSNGIGNGRRLDTKRGSRRECSIGE